MLFGMLKKLLAFRLSTGGQGRGGDFSRAADTKPRPVSGRDKYLAELVYQLSTDVRVLVADTEIERALLELSISLNGGHESAREALSALQDNAQDQVLPSQAPDCEWDELSEAFRLSTSEAGDILRSEEVAAKLRDLRTSFMCRTSQVRRGSSGAGYQPEERQCYSGREDDIGVLEGYGIENYTNGLWGRAVIAFKEVLRRDESHGMAHAYLGFCCNRWWLFDEAEEHFREAMELGVGSADPHVIRCELSHSLKLQGKHAEAGVILSDLQKTTDARPEVVRT